MAVSSFGFVLFSTWLSLKVFKIEQWSKKQNKKTKTESSAGLLAKDKSMTFHQMAYMQHHRCEEVAVP